MKLTVIGSGYVGLVAGSCFSEMGNDVWCIDIDKNRIDNLKKGVIPIYEKGLEQLVKKNFEEGRLHFSSDIFDGFNDSTFIFIAVGTPPNEDGSADLKHVLNVAKTVGEHLNDYKIIINKSTVPVGTAEKVREVINQKLIERKVSIEFDVVSNPEFLKEGDAVNDFMSPDRVIIGSSSKKAQNLIGDLYSVFFKQHPRIIFMDEKSAEITKYASNAMLATKISFMNDMANFCEKAGADIEMVRLGIGADKRIGYSFIYPGIGYGGSCFPKDVKAIIKTAGDFGYDMKLLNAVEDVNNAQKNRIYEKISDYYKSGKKPLKGMTFAIWGLSFKPETDDMREAPAINTIRKLVGDGALIHAHDPEAVNEAKKIFGDISGKIKYFDNNYDCLEGADALILLTEWHIYRQPDFARMKSKYGISIIFDGRNQYDPEDLKKSALNIIASADVSTNDYIKFKPMKILITGGAGFIGSHVEDLYINSGHEVAVIDNMVFGRVENLNPKAKFYPADIRSGIIDKIFEIERPDIVNHHAAQISDSLSMTDPLLDAEINISGFLNILENSVKHGVKKIIFISSGGAVYGNSPEYPTTENSQCKPLSPYGISKYSAENYLRYYFNRHNLDYTILRYSNVYGPRQIPHGDAGVVSIFFKKLINSESPVIFRFDNYPSGSFRDYVYVEDAAYSNLLSLEKGSREIFNISSGSEISTSGLFNEISGIVNKNIEPVFREGRSGELKRSCLRNEKAGEILGWKPEYDLKSGLLKTFMHLKNNNCN